MIGNRYRQRHVDADHADLDVITEVAGGFAITGVDAGAVAVFVIIDQLHGGFHRIGAHDQQHRAEDLFLVAGHLRGDAIDQGAADEEAVLAAFDLRIAAIDHHRRALLLGAVDVADHLVTMGRGDQRAEIIALVAVDADLEAFHLLLHLRDQLVGGVIAHGHRDGQCHATLTGGAEGGAIQ